MLKNIRGWWRQIVLDEILFYFILKYKVDESEK